MDTVLVIALALIGGIVAFFWSKSKAQELKTSVLDKKVELQKEKSDEAVKDAVTSADIFLAKLRQYKSSSGSSGSDSKSE